MPNATFTYFSGDCEFRELSLTTLITCVSYTMEGLTSPVRRSVFLAPLTEEELNAVTVVFHQYETGLREGCIFTKVVTY